MTPPKPDAAIVTPPFPLNFTLVNCNGDTPPLGFRWKLIRTTLPAPAGSGVRLSNDNEIVPAELLTLDVSVHPVVNAPNWTSALFTVTTVGSYVSVMSIAFTPVPSDIVIGTGTVAPGALVYSPT